MVLDEIDDEGRPLLGNSTDEEAGLGLAHRVARSGARHFVSGACLVADIIFPIAFWGLLIRDTNEFCLHPENRYGNSLIKIWLGIANNEQAYASQMNINLARSPLWQPALAVPLAMALIGGANYLLHQGAQYDDGQPLMHGYLHDLLAPLNPRSAFSCYLASLEEVYLTQGEILSEADLAYFLTDLKYRTGLARHYSSAFIAKYISLHAESEQQKFDDLLEVESKVGSLGRYTVWAQGLSTSRADNLFNVKYFFQYYPSLVMLIIGIKSCIDTAKERTRRHECAAAGHTYQYSNVFKLNDCVVCDWEILPLAKSAESCINSAIQYASTPAIIYDRLKSLHPDQSVTFIDLSNQDIGAWSETELHLVLSELERLAKHPLQTIDFSLSSQMSELPSMAMMQRLGKFLQRMDVSQVDLSGRLMGDESLHTVLQAFHNKTIPTFILSNNDIGAVGLTSLTDSLLTSHLQVTNLHLDNNPLQDANLTGLASYASQANSTLAQLNLSYTQLPNTALSSFFDQINADSGMEGLALAGLELDANSLRALSRLVLRVEELDGVNIANSNLGKLGIDSLISMMPRLEKINLSENNLSEYQVYQLLSNAARLIAVDISDNQIQSLGLALKNMPLTIEKINFSFNPVDGSDFIEAVIALRESNVTDIRMSGIPYQSAMIMDFVQGLSNKTIALNRLDISNAGLMSNDVDLILSLPHLQALNISGNALNDSAISALSSINRDLFSLDISDNSFSQVGSGHFLSALPSTQVQSLAMNNIRVNDVSVVNLFRSTIAVTPHIQSLADKQLGRDELRALYDDCRNTTLNELSLAGAELTPGLERAYLRTFPASRMRSRGLFLPRDASEKPFSIPTHASVLVIASGLGIAIALFLVLLLAHRIGSYITNKRTENKLRQAGLN